mmetsp:Transcript_808/g.2432  ORF Transcript_808/g.2432 Transcript_808/m.2432 type:complete len:285 (-) Transcript_808:3016-3870(-)
MLSRLGHSTLLAWVGSSIAPATGWIRTVTCCDLKGVGQRHAFDIFLPRQLSTDASTPGSIPTGSSATSSGSDPWETLVGLELHVQVDSKTKLFSAAPTSVGRQPNTHVSVFDAALPGTLPVINRACVEAAAVTGIALGGNVNRLSSFDRKHYFYADLPHGFQITQLREPIVSGGALDVAVGDTVKRVGIQRIQLEVDTGKSTHDLDPRYSCIDLNRAGSALMEVVTGPDLRSGDEAAAFVRTFQQLLRHVGTSDGNMEDGSLRVDVNVSVVCSSVHLHVPSVGV